MRLGVVGATGAVGVEVLRSLEHRRVEVAELRLFASPSSVGTLLAFRGEQIAVQALVEDGSCFDGLSVVIFAASKAVAQQFAPLAAKRGAVAVDNSSFFRLDPEVPLVVPEINGADIFLHKGIISNPNCTTAICLMALHPLHLRFKLVRVFASSYQAVSGTGQKAIVELKSQMADLVHGRPIQPPKVYKHQIANNVIAQVDDFADNGYTREELKLVNEGRKIMHHPDFKASITCVRVPVERAHSIAVVAQFESQVSVVEAKEILSRCPGVKLCEKNEDFPTPLTVQRSELVSVGRIRLDLASEDNKGLCMWIVGDQLLKGAAQNAVQIAEIVQRKHL